MGRDCTMTRPECTVLWMGLMYLHTSDEQLDADVRTFFEKHAKAYTVGMKIRIQKTHYKKAVVVLQVPIPRDLVHSLNSKDFVEDGKPHKICVTTRPEAQAKSAQGQLQDIAEGVTCALPNLV